jgi:hypothetical protein
MRLIKYLTYVFLIIFMFFLIPPATHSQEVSPLSEMMQDEVLTYILDISGTVLHKPFENVRAVMTISVPPAGARNPYVVNIFRIGFPNRDERNTFIWYSDDSYMTYLPGSISCRVKYSYMEIPENIHFFYASPILYRPPEDFHTQHEAEEAARLADIVLLPTKVTAQAGKLDIFINGNRVSGRVWIKGYDNIEDAYVDYAASFTGRTFYGMDIKMPELEPHPMHILEQTDERYR